MIAVIIIIISSSIIYIANSCAFVIITMMTSTNNYYYCIVCSNIFNYIPRPGLPPARRNMDVYSITPFNGWNKKWCSILSNSFFNLHYWKTILSFWGPVTFQGRCCWTSGGVVKLDHFQFVRVEIIIKNLWNHHLSCLLLGCLRNLVDG